MGFGSLKEVSNLIRYYVIRVGTDVVQSLWVGVGGRHKRWVETGGKISLSILALSESDVAVGDSL